MVNRSLKRLKCVFIALADHALCPNTTMVERKDIFFNVICLPLYRKKTLDKVVALISLH